VLFAGSSEGFTAVKKRIDATLKPRSMALTDTAVSLHLDIQRKPTVSANLLGMVEGSDPDLRREYVLIGAHLDHVGMNMDGYVFNGADDNGSGSVGVLQCAKAFATNPIKPKRSILFAHWTGEEKGLLGSRYFAEFPPFPIENIVACINLDMISRDTTLKSIFDAAKEVGIGREQLSYLPDEPENLLACFSNSLSPGLADSAVQMGKKYCGRILVPMLSNPMLGNSDHYPFSQKSIPTVLFNTERHRDLHQPSDTVEKINVDKMTRVVKLVYTLAFSMAEDPKRPKWLGQ
jgi:Zn-dependent M28 family amino/carboxypeptidase